MASSFHMLTAGFCLLIVCAARLSLTAPVDDVPPPSGEEEYEETDNEDETTQGKSSETTSPPLPTTLNQTTTLIQSSTTQLTSNQSKNATAEVATTTGTKSTSSTTVTSSTSLSTTSAPPEGTKPEADKPTEDVPDVVVYEQEQLLPWAHNTWASIIVPVSVGLGSALFLIAWICCVRRCCCGKCGRWRSPPYKDRLRATAGPPKKALREDFRQLRARDRMKLLAESSDEEF